MVTLIMLVLYALILLIPLLYWLSMRKFNYWSDRGVKGPTPVPLFGNMIELIFREKRNEEISLLKKYGKIYGVYNGNQPVLTVADPELIQNILVKDFHLFTDRQAPGFMAHHPILSKHMGFQSGQDWKRIRYIVSPTFTSSKMRRMYPYIKGCLQEFVSVLEPYSRDGRPLDFKEFFERYTVDSIATCAFSTKTNAQNDPKSPFIQNAMEIHNPNPYKLIALLTLPAFVLRVLNIKYTSGESANEFYFGLTRHMLSERKKSSEKHNDFIQLILNAQKSAQNRTGIVVRDDEDVYDSHHVNEGKEELALEEKTRSEVKDKFITEDEILAQVWAFFNAGYQSTSTSLSCAVYELALNQDIQQRLYEEVLTAVDANGDIDYDLLSRLPFLDSVISETLRIHSTALRLTRRAAEDYKLGKTGITIEKGHSIEIPIHAIHNSEIFYEEPSRFNPDRFMPDNRHKITPYTYLPFGGGPRSCVGMRFALINMKLCLAKVVISFKLSKSNQTDIPLVHKNVPGINPIKRVVLGIERRV